MRRSHATDSSCRIRHLGAWLRASRGAGLHPVGGGASQRSQGPPARVERGRAAVRDWAHSRRREDRLGNRPQRSAGARLRRSGALRGGHIPGAKSIPWGRAVTPETHTFRPAEELRTIYEAENGLGANDDVVAYCRIGERSSHTWFALTYLLGFKNVRNYDGSWTEWGNTVKAPIEKP